MKIFLLILLLAVAAWLFMDRFLNDQANSYEELVSQEVDVDKLSPRLKAIYIAEQVNDPVSRCLEYPAVEGVGIDPEYIEHFCAESGPDYAEIFNLLNSRQFETVELLIDQALEHYLETGQGEFGLYTFFHQIDDMPSWSRPLVESWLEMRPDSAAALHAKALLVLKDASQIQRGLRLGQLSADERASHSKLMTEANRLSERVLDLNPQFLPALETRLSSARYESDEMVLYWYNKGLAVAPNSYFLRSAYLFQLLPQWGGSFEEMEAFINKATLTIGENFRTRLMHGRVYLERARLEWASGSHERALEIHNEGLRKSAWSQLWSASANVLDEMGDNLGAFERVSQVTRYPGYRPHEESRRIFMLIQFSEFRWAQQLALRAIERYPEQTNIRVNLGWLYKRDMQYQEALDQYEKVLVIEPDNKMAHQDIAWISTYRVRDLKRAKPHIDALLSKNPENYHAWLYMADYLHDTGGDPLFEAMDNFLKYVDRDDPNMASSITAIENYLATHSRGAAEPDSQP